MNGVIHRRVLVAVVLVVALLAAGGPGLTMPAVLSDSVRVDSLGTRQRLTAHPLDVVSPFTYGRRHAFSFDQFMAAEHGFVVERFGPAGGWAAFSRYGLGRGRATVVFDGIPLNDPQNDQAPIAHMPVSRFGTIHMQGDDSDGVAPTSSEGFVSISAPPPPVSKPETFIELSKGTNDLKQRRVRFSSIESSLGVDLSYDELLNDGYVFDASETNLAKAPTASRSLGIGLRGTLDRNFSYKVGYQNFESSMDGDLDGATSERKYNGEVARASISWPDLDVNLFGRGYSSYAPDSNVVNQTSGAYMRWQALRSSSGTITVRAGAEDIDVTQEVGTGNSRRRVTRLYGNASASFPLVGGATITTDINIMNYPHYAGAWGGKVSLGRTLGRHTATISTGRNFRLPNLGELFVPYHIRGGRRFQGNPDVKPEWTLEVEGCLSSVVGPVTNEVTIGAIGAENSIGYKASAESGITIFSPRNGGGETATVISERLKMRTELLGIEFDISGGATFLSSDRTGYFMSVPETRLGGSLRAGRSLFEATSALYLGIDIIQSSARKDFLGNDLAEYRVIDFSIEGRLLDARLYMALQNAFNTSYTTSSDYLMTPRTFLYGVSWSLYE